MRTILPEQAMIVKKMFEIQAKGATYLLNEANNIKHLPLQLDIGDFISIEQNKELMFNISLAIGILDLSEKIIRQLLSALLKQLR